MRKTLVLIATGFEDVELITTLDILSRSNLHYDLYSVEDLIEVKGKFNAIVKTKRISDLDSSLYQAIFLPGGPGYEILMKSSTVIKLVQDFYRAKKIIAAICAAPAILAKADILKDNVKITCHATVASDLPSSNNLECALDQKILTGRDFRATPLFADEFVKLLLA